MGLSEMCANLEKTEFCNNKEERQNMPLVYTVLMDLLIYDAAVGLFFGRTLHAWHFLFRGKVFYITL